MELRERSARGEHLRWIVGVEMLGVDHVLQRHGGAVNRDLERATANGQRRGDREPACGQPVGQVSDLGQPREPGRRHRPLREHTLPLGVVSQASAL